MKIRALVPFSTGTITMEQYEVREVTDSLGNELISAGVAVEIGGGGLPPVTASDAGKVLSVNNSGVWGAQNLPIRVFDIDVNIDEGLTQLTPTSSTTYPTADELEMIYANNGAVACHLHVNDVSLNNTIYLRPARIDADGVLYLCGEFIFGRERKFCYGYISTVGIGINVSKDNRFIVTLTPTALDYSGTMNVSVGAIDEAYKAGQQVVFRLHANENQWYEMDSTERGGDSSTTYPSYNACGIVGSVFAKFYTGATDDGTKITYSTNIYTLTPAT